MVIGAADTSNTALVSVRLSLVAVALTARSSRALKSFLLAVLAAVIDFGAVAVVVRIADVFRGCERANSF